MTVSSGSLLVLVLVSRGVSGLVFIYSFVPPPDRNEAITPERHMLEIVPSPASRGSRLGNRTPESEPLAGEGMRHLTRLAITNRIFSTDQSSRHSRLTSSLYGSTRGRGGNGIHVSMGNLLRLAGTTSSYLVNPLVSKSVPAASEPSDRSSCI